MKIQFCEFCGNVMREQADYCNVCGCYLAQDVEDVLFNNPDMPWPFSPVNQITLRIHGRPHYVHFEGTHSLFHLWRGMSRYYNEQSLWFRVHNDEMELASFPAGQAKEDFRILEPGDILNCKQTRFSCHGYANPDPELQLEDDNLVHTYQGTFQLLECPEKDIPFVLGWLLATGPKPRFLEGWVFDI